MRVIAPLLTLADLGALIVAALVLSSPWRLVALVPLAVSAGAFLFLTAASYRDRTGSAKVLHRPDHENALEITLALPRAEVEESADAAPSSPHPLAPPAGESPTPESAAPKVTEGWALRVSDASEVFEPAPAHLPAPQPAVSYRGADDDQPVMGADSDEAWYFQADEPVSVDEPGRPATGAGAGGSEDVPPAQIDGGDAATPAPGVPTGPSASAADQPPQDPPRSAYARLSAPDQVVGGSEFELRVGLTAQPDPGVVGDALVRAAASVGPYTLVAHMVADRFALRDGEAWRQELRVTYEAPYPAVTLHLVAPALANGTVDSAAITATFSIEGQTVGYAARSVTLLGDGAPRQDSGAPPVPPPIVVALPVADTAPDLTLTIRIGASDGELVWTWESPHPVPLNPAEPPRSNIGRRPREFATAVMSEMSQAEGNAAVPFAIRGISRQIAQHVPEIVWSVIDAVVSMRPDKCPTVQLLSEEPYIPWELAEMPAPPTPGAAPLLAAQVVIARWVLGQQTPRQPPPHEHDMYALAVVVGDYSKTAHASLASASVEARWLEATFGAQLVNASRDVVLALLGSGGGDLIHFAVHGRYSGAARDGLILADNWTLTEFQIGGATLTAQPLIVLNACQVGQGSELLGDYAGLAAAFLRAGASAVVAPLWSISDDLAKVFCQEFYTRVHAGTSPAQALHELRQRWVAQNATTSISLAYLFFGHPRLTLEWSGDDQRGAALPATTASN